jgi:hypothetical protein
MAGLKRMKALRGFSGCAQSRLELQKAASHEQFAQVRRQIEEK